MEDFESLTEKLARITIERDRLREENCRLRELLRRASEIDESLGTQGRRLLPKELDSVPEDVLPAPVEICRNELSIPEKISLFRSLFRGREDVYAVRFETLLSISGTTIVAGCINNRPMESQDIRRLVGAIGMRCVLSRNRNGRNGTGKHVNSCL